MVLMQYSREHPDAQMAAQILALEETAWPSDGENAPFPSAPETYVTSFVLLDEGRAICHVGIRNSSLSHKGQTYLAYGLSEVVTHPQYQNQGLGSQNAQGCSPVYPRPSPGYQRLYLRSGKGFLLHARRVAGRSRRMLCGRHSRKTVPQRYSRIDYDDDVLLRQSQTTQIGIRKH